MNEELIAEIRQVWVNHPDLRFGQLLSTAMDVHRRTSAKELDLFYITDNDFVRILREFDDWLSSRGNAPPRFK
jgi:hypothetical protein